MDSKYLFVLIAYLYVFIRFIVISFKIYRNAKSINFLYFSPIRINKENKYTLLRYSLYIVIIVLIIMNILLFRFNIYLILALSGLYFPISIKVEHIYKKESDNENILNE